MPLLMGLNISELYHMCCWGDCAFTLFHTFTLHLFLLACLLFSLSALLCFCLSSHPTAGCGRWLLLTQPCSAEGLFLLKLSSTY